MNLEKTDYKTALENSGVITVVPKGNSMWPFIKGGKCTVIIKKPISPINQLDVVLFQRENGDFVLHRVTKIDGEELVVKGDNFNYQENISSAQVLGVMEGFYYKNKYTASNDQKYIKRVHKWYKNTLCVKIKKGFFGLWQLKKRILTKIFARKQKNV